MFPAWFRRRLDPSLAPGAHETRRVWRRSRALWLTGRHWRARFIVWLGGLGVAGAAMVFAVGAEYMHELFKGIVHISPYLPLIISPLGLASIVLITRRFFYGSEGSGIPQTIAALGIEDQKIVKQALGLKIALGKIFLTLLAMLSGASVGREGPTVQVGAAIMYNLGRLSRNRSRRMQRGLILAGGAAGVAAAFNTPLAGVVFAIEEMNRSFEARANGVILTAVILSGIVSVGLLGNYTYFGKTSVALTSDESWIPVLLCGVSGGLLGGLFAQTLILFSQGIGGPIGRFVKERPVALAAVCGLLLALLGIASGGTTFGTGYEEAKAILDNPDALPAVYGPIKILATIISYVSGVPGGIFAPSLAAGAGIGSIISSMAPYAPPASVVLLGMVGYLAGAIQAPITAFVIVMEMTDNHEMVVPLMAAALVAHGSSRLVCRRALYHTMAENFLEASKPRKSRAD
ncbi:MAG: chloride channel protein [Betaproteobacteria bacterium]|nr:chloride channel protein [Betaproteobacteria bacterium]